MYVYRYVTSESGALFKIVFAPFPQARPGGEPCIVHGYVLPGTYQYMVILVIL